MIANQTSMRDAMRMKLQYVCSRVGRLTLLNWKFWVCVTLVCLYHFLHWSRMPYRDRVSPDGRYIVEVYGNFFAGFIPCAPGQGGDRSGKVVLKDRRTGKVSQHWCARGAALASVRSGVSRLDEKRPSRENKKSAVIPAVQVHFLD